MTSLQTHIAQIPGRVRYFVTLEAVDNYTVIAGKTALSLMDNADPESTTFSQTNSFLAVLEEGETVEGVLRDMGKSITVIDVTTKQQVELWRLVQKQSDGAPRQTEGANLTGDAYLPFYVKVWDSNGDGVHVVRTG
jgi:hypothetical protein